MDTICKKVKSILEYVLIFTLVVIGIRKGGYYKEDSLICEYVIFLISIIYCLISGNNLKYNKTIGRLVVFFAICYAIPIILLNTATVSGAINIALRIYSMFLVYIIISNSLNKEKYKKALVVFTVICGVFALDELSYRIFNPILKAIGGGYVEENSGRIASIFQYSNLLGILSLISVLYLLNCLSKAKDKRSIIIYPLISFLTIVMFLTQSKMIFVLYLVMTTVFCIYFKRKWNILVSLANFIYCLLISSLIQEYIVFVIIPALFLDIIYGYIVYTLNKKNNAKAKNIINVVMFLAVLVTSVCCYTHILNSGIMESFSDYLDNFNSTKLRITYYIDALKIVFKSPLNFLIGTGGNSFRTLYETVQTTEYISLEVHSFFIQVLLEAGLLGLIAITATLIYTLKKSNSFIHKMILISLIIYSAFDVFLTYTFMLYLLIGIIAITGFETEELGKKEKIANVVVFMLFFIVISLHVIALFTMPLEVDNLNNSLEKQESVVKRCEIALKFDPYDIDYMRKYTLACSTYLDILDIKEELYELDYTENKQETISKIYNNIKNEMKYEKSNKYAIEDNVYYVYKYVDELVSINYSQNEKEGYEYYLNEILDNNQKLKEEHSLNDYANEVYTNCLSSVYTKFSYVNSIINSDKIENELNILKENESISL